MKKHFTKLFLFFITIIFAQSEMFAQDILDVPPLDDANMPTLASTIMGDTTATGERKSANRVYRLQRNAIYIMDATVVANYDVRIIAEDGTDRPPIIAAGKDAEANNVFPFFSITGEGTSHSFKDIIFQGVDTERKYNKWFQGLVFNADNLSVSFQGCVFNAFTGGATQFYGSKNLSLYFRDCVWRNGVASNHPFIGQQVTLDLQMDTLIVTNCTYFNNNSFWLFQEVGLSKFTVIEHNTIFTSLIDMMRLRYTSNTNIRSNLFYGTHAFGDTPTSRTNKWYEPDNSPYSIISLYEVPSDILDAAGFTEAGRVVNVTNNAYYTPQKIRDYWDADATITGVVWMNDRTKALFNDGSHPDFYAKDNIEKNPNFTDTDMDTWVVDQVTSFCTTFRSTDSDNGHAFNGDAGSLRNYDEHKGVDILSGLTWPLPETMAYSDAELLAGGHDGLPIGDLNWDPAKRAQYVEPTTIEKLGATPAFANKQTAAVYGNFFAKWNVTPTHAPMDGATGLGKTEAPNQGFSAMGILVRFNSSGKIDARNGTNYEALADLSYEAGKTYTIAVSGNVKDQTYTVDVTPDGGTRVRIGEDYAFRVNNPQDTLNYFSMVINELEQFGGVVGSRLNPSFMDDPYTSDSYELNIANNTSIDPQDGNFTATFDMMPTAQAIDAVISFSKGEAVVQGYSALSCILRCNQAGVIDARDGTGYSAVNPLNYTAGTVYSVTMDFDVAAQTYSATVTPAGGSPTVIATDYAFRATADTLNNLAKLIGTGGMFGGKPGDLVISNFNMTISSVNDINAPEFSMYPNPANNSLFISAKEEVENLEVYSLLGRRLISLPINGQLKTDIDISALAKGVYMLYVSSSRGTASKLFVKQ